VNISRWADLILETLVEIHPALTPRSEGSWSGEVSWSHLNHSISQHCPVFETLRLGIDSAFDGDAVDDFARGLKLELYGNSLQIYGLPTLLSSPPCCVALLAHAASLSPFVLSVAIGEDFGFANADGTSSVQSDRMGLRPYHDAGLTGAGQICGVADTGVNDLSCFFADDAETYRTHATSRTWAHESLRRKIVQYVPFADSVDDEGGHGTHTCGTLAGASSSSVFSEENGVAPGAKIAFFDIGFSLSTLPLAIPRLHSVLFPTAYGAGARVHSDSWAGGLQSYAEHSLEIDSFLYEHTDFLAILAVGNSGLLGPGHIGSPANSKNALCVGSTQIRGETDDSLSSTGPWLALSSSLGPTFDGRFKPDILALGEGVVSAYSSSVESQYEAQLMKYSLWSKSDLDSHWSTLASCAVHEKSGTSMATPLIAGSALLIRQFFMEPRFWASLCSAPQLWCRPFEPSGYLLKALILHGGTGVSRSSDPDLSPINPLGSPPDSFQGYGVFGLHHVLPLPGEEAEQQHQRLVVFDQLLIAERTVLRFEIDFLPSTSSLLSSSAPLKITLCWFDPPSLVGWLSHLLVHDIDLALLGPGGEVFWGNNATGGDSLNPNEQILVSHPASFCPSPPEPCRFSLLLQSHALPYRVLEGDREDNRTQAVALVFTTSGHVSGPAIVSRDHWPSVAVCSEEHQLSPSSPTPPRDPRPLPETTSPALPTYDHLVTVDFFSVPLSVSIGSGSGAAFVHSVVPIASFENPLLGLAHSPPLSHLLRTPPVGDPPPLLSVDPSCPFGPRPSAGSRSLSPHRHSCRPKRAGHRGLSQTPVPLTPSFCRSEGLSGPRGAMASTSAAGPPSGPLASLLQTAVPESGPPLAMSHHLALASLAPPPSLPPTARTPSSPPPLSLPRARVGPPPLSGP
jgi:hypothetical protein